MKNQKNVDKQKYSKSYYPGIFTVTTLVWILPDLFLCLCICVCVCVWFTLHTYIFTYTQIFFLKTRVVCIFFTYIYTYLFTRMVIVYACSFIIFLVCYHIMYSSTPLFSVVTICLNFNPSLILGHLACFQFYTIVTLFHT